MNAVLPLAAVSPGDVTVTEPENVVTRLLLTSTISTDGCVASATPLAAVAEGDATNWIAVGVPATGVTLAETTESDACVKRSVRAERPPVKSRSVKFARPFTSVLIVRVPLSVPPPVFTDTTTGRPALATALPLISASCTIGCTGKTIAFCGAGDACVTMVSDDGEPAVFTFTLDDVAVVTPLDAKASVRAPSVPRIRRSMKVAVPVTSVSWLVVPCNEPPPAAIAEFTLTPDVMTLLPAASWSRTLTVPRSASLVAVAGGCATMTSCVATPTPRAKLVDVAGVSTGALVKPSVRAPVVPEIERPAKVATPLLTATVAVPFSVPPPDAMTTVTFPLYDVARLPFASSTRTTGCVPNAAPLFAPAGCVNTDRAVAAPAPSVRPDGTVRVPSVKESV